MGVLILLIALQTVISSVLGKWKAKILEKTDARVKYTKEVLHGIRVVKCYAWEEAFIQKVRTKNVHSCS